MTIKKYALFKNAREKVMLLDPILGKRRVIYVREAGMLEIYFLGLIEIRSGINLAVDFPGMAETPRGVDRAIGALRHGWLTADTLLHMVIVGFHDVSTTGPRHAVILG